MATDSKNIIVGVDLLNDVHEAGSGTNLGVCIISGQEMHRLKVHDVRQSICLQVVACPPQFTICTRQGWQIAESQEKFIQLSQILTDQGNVYICVKHEHPKVGIKDRNDAVVGFVSASFNSTLKTLKNLVYQQILQPIGYSETFQFLEGNSWPISTVQENHMIISDILICSSVCTDLHIKDAKEFTEIAQLEPPPIKKRKGSNLGLSFNSGKDISRLTSGDSTKVDTTAKQVLISYVRVEAAKHALCLKEELSALGFSVYLDVHEIQSGVDWQDSLNFAVSECEVFIPLVTQKYGETQWTNREVKLADVLGKYILPINFLPEWPPRCLAIQFATTQFIPWVPPDELNERLKKLEIDLLSHDQWTASDIQKVAFKIADRIKGLSLSSVPSLLKRATVVKSCACVTGDNQMAITADREGKPLIVVCLHPQEKHYGLELCGILEKEGFEVWCTTELDREHMDHIDGLANSQEGVSYSTVIECNYGNQDLRCIQEFQEKADDASVVLLVLSEAFAMSRTCQQQVFYCEHRKRVIPILYEVFEMPEWMVMLIGSKGFEMRREEDFVNILVSRVKATMDSSPKLGKTFSSLTNSSNMANTSTTGIRKSVSMSGDIPQSPTKRPSLTTMKTMML